MPHIPINDVPRNKYRLDVVKADTSRPNTVVLIPTRNTARRPYLRHQWSPDASNMVNNRPAAQQAASSQQPHSNDRQWRETRIVSGCKIQLAYFMIHKNCDGRHLWFCSLHSFEHVTQMYIYLMKRMEDDETRKWTERYKVTHYRNFFFARVRSISIYFRYISKLARVRVAKKAHTLDSGHNLYKRHIPILIG